MRAIRSVRTLLCAGVFAFFLLVSMTIPTFAATRKAADGAPVTICVGDTLPPDTVIIARRYDPNQCNGSNPFIAGFNVEMVVPAPVPGNAVAVCADSPLPPEDVIIAELPFSPSCFGPQRVITPASGNAVTICQDSPIPQGYMQTGMTKNLSCGINPLSPLSNNAIIIEPVLRDAPLNE